MTGKLFDVSFCFQPALFSKARLSLITPPAWKKHASFENIYNHSGKIFAGKKEFCLKIKLKENALNKTLKAFRKDKVYNKIKKQGKTPTNFIFWP